MFHMMPRGGATTMKFLQMDKISWNLASDSLTVKHQEGASHIFQDGLFFLTDIFALIVIFQKLVIVNKL